MKKKCLFFLLILYPFLLLTAQWKGIPVDFTHGKIIVSQNKRYLIHEDGTPFFYLGDTAWELFHRLNREEADMYLQDRASKGFTVIQAVALAELGGLSEPNAYGYLPFASVNIEKPKTREGNNNDYWDHVDYIIDKANQLGMYVGLLPTWGNLWHDSNFFNPANAKRYGVFLGERYKEKKIIWILGGDRNIKNKDHYNIMISMIEGLKEGGATDQLITYHPSGESGSSQWFHNDNRFDFNMRQNSHNPDYTNVYSKTLEDYQRSPAKPVIDGEPLYEDHPLSFEANKYGHSVTADVRRTLYWNLFNGAFGYTYGHHSIWQMYDPNKNRLPINNPLIPWQKALNQPGSEQMTYGRLLIESRPYLSRIPDPSIIVSDRVTTSVPGEGRYRFVATRDIEGTYVMVYAPVGRSFKVRTELIRGEKIKAWWYNPRNGKASSIGTFFNDKKDKEFISPDKGELTDWILVLDDASYNYPTPGKRLKGFLKSKFR